MGANAGANAGAGAGAAADSAGGAHGSPDAPGAGGSGADAGGVTGQTPPRAGGQSSGAAASSGKAELFAKLLSAQRPAAEVTASPAPRAAAASVARPAAAGTAATSAPVDIPTLLGELTGTKPAGVATTGTSGGLSTTAAKKKEARKDDATDFDGSQSTVLDMQALLRLLETPVAPRPQAPAGDDSAQTVVMIMDGQGKATLTGDAATPGPAAANATTQAAAGATTLLAATDSSTKAQPDLAAIAVPAALTAPAASAAAAPAQPQTATQISADASANLVISQTLTQPVTADAAAAAPGRSISLPVGHRDWSGAIATHVLWQVKSDVQSARVQLTPEGMGPVDVRIDVDGKQVSVNFTAAHVETRQALEQSVPQLRAMLAGSGLTLGQTSVQQQARQDSPAPGSSSGQRDGDHSSDAAVVSTVMARRGLVDEYA